MKLIPIHGSYITLGQFLKLTNCIDTGGQAKGFLEQTLVKVNGEPEQRRGRKLKPGDQIEVSGHGVFQLTEQNECF